MNIATTEPAATYTYLIAHRSKGKKWLTVAKLVMPADSCLASAKNMADAAGYCEFEVIIPHPGQKNILPVSDKVPTVTYDARIYWKHRWDNMPSVRDMIAEQAASEGVILQ